MKQELRVNLQGENFYSDLAVVKSCVGRTWDAGKKQWIVPATNDNLVRLEGIPYLRERVLTIREQLKLSEKMVFEEALTIKKDYPFLFDYQAVGAFYSLHKKFYLIADEMGLGKTVQMMPLIDISMQEKRKVIILAPSSLLPQWQSEIKRFIDKDSIILSGKKGTRASRITAYDYYMQSGDPAIILTTYESFVRDTRDIQTFWNDVVIIADEASKFKNVKTRIWRELNWLRPRVHAFIALTGTPVENSLNNFFNIISVVAPEFMTTREFKSQYCEWQQKPDGYHELIGYKNLSDFLQRVSPLMIRRKKCDVAELPEKIIQNRIIPLTPLQHQVIDGIRRFANNDQTSDTAALGALILLREIADDLRMFYDSTSPMVNSLKGSGYIPRTLPPDHCDNKFQEVATILDEAGDNKVLIFTQFKTIAHMLNRYLTGEGNTGIRILTGDSSADERVKAIEDFKEDKFKVLIATEIFGYGMNLQFVDILINFDIPWNPAKLNQRIDRIHRTGAKNDKIIINLIAEDIEERVKEVLDTKQDLFDQVVDGQAINDENVRKEILQKLRGK